MKTYQKVLILIPAAFVFWWSVFFGLNYYEVQNKCRFDFSKDHLTCIPKENYRNADDMVLKPLILLYPTKPTHVDVRLDYDGEFTATFPEYSSLKRGWLVEASPESIIQDKWTGQETYGLFWEWKKLSNVPYDLSHGFVLRWSEVRDFLYTTLREMNLSPKEYSDFIMFWYPKLQDYPYVQITFAGKDYTDRARLMITPTPDNIFRVFMVAKPLDVFQAVPPQKIEKFNRTWFHVLEWGGTIIQ